MLLQIQFVKYKIELFNLYIEYLRSGIWRSQSLFALESRAAEDLGCFLGNIRANGTTSRREKLRKKRH
jgi:hypothetical protein